MESLEENLVRHGGVDGRANGDNGRDNGHARTRTKEGNGNTYGMPESPYTDRRCLLYGLKDCSVAGTASSEGSD